MLNNHCLLCVVLVMWIHLRLAQKCSSGSGVIKQLGRVKLRLEKGKRGGCLCSYLFMPSFLYSCVLCVCVCMYSFFLSPYIYIVLKTCIYIHTLCMLCRVHVCGHGLSSVFVFTSMCVLHTYILYYYKETYIVNTCILCVCVWFD